PGARPSRAMSASFVYRAVAAEITAAAMASPSRMLEGKESPNTFLQASTLSDTVAESNASSISARRLCMRLRNDAYWASVQRWSKDVVGQLGSLTLGFSGWS